MPHHTHQPLCPLSIHRLSHPAATPPPCAAIRRTATPDAARPSAASQPDRPHSPAQAGNTASSAPPSAAGIAPRPADHRVGTVYQRKPFSQAHGPDLLRKKSRSTVNWPIFSYSGASWASSAIAPSFPLAWLRRKSVAVPFRLELSAVLLPCIGHVSPSADRPVQRGDFLLATCPVSGVHLTSCANLLPHIRSCLRK